MNHVFFKSESVHHATPKAVYDQLNAEFYFTHDPCPLGGGDHTGLTESWAGKRVYCNPPYGPGIKDWLVKADEADIAVFLLPARTDVRWFHDIVLPKAKEIRFVRGRLKFRDNDPSWKPGSGTAPFPSMIVVMK